MAVYPSVPDPGKVGDYPAAVKAGGDYVWDEVLEYRVWCSPRLGAEVLEDRNDYYYVFETGKDAQQFAAAHPGAKQPLALVLQREYLDEDKPGEFRHVRAERLTELPLAFLSRARRTARTIPDFLATEIPANNVHLLRAPSDQ